MKTCIRCEESKDESLFGWHNKSKGRRRTVCRECRNIDARSWRKQSKEVLNKRVRDRFRKKKKEWVHKFGNICANCGGSFPPAVYDFHHINPNEKDISPGQLFSRTDDKIEKELNKCVMLCANCHRMEHHDYD